MRNLIFVLLFAAANVASANSEKLAGQFTHDFTNPANEPVWTVTKSGSRWKVFSHGANKVLRAKEASESERRDFYEQMWWPAEKALGAKCLRISGDWPGMMCYIPVSERTGIAGLANNKSDYFYFDSMGGLREIRLKRR
ncbi:hypothetical protein [Massilia sp. GCM10023247]|uniref:hypothetical protein n=1 Tax=Massilia sp. GCM10023247 TaxID=3252643 RepID=UPI00360B2DB5